MFDFGDTLLYAISDWRETSWPVFRKAFRELLRASKLDRELESDLEYVVNPAAALRVLEALGHCDASFETAPGSVYAAPPVLAVLPDAGFPRAILCGSRAPDTIIALQDAVQRNGKANLRVESQRGRNPNAPSRVEIQAENDQALVEVSKRADVLIKDRPTAWLLIQTSGGLAEYLDALTWTDEPELNWPRANFDHARLKFVPATDMNESELRGYRNPATGLSQHRLWDGHRSAIVDLDWGRFAALASSETAVLFYDRRSGELRVPATVPLPKLLSRGLALLSGYAPARCDPYESVALVGRVMPVISFADVPTDVLETVRVKLGQPMVVDYSRSEVAKRKEAWLA